jgi:acyl-CoA oxidase
MATKCTRVLLRSMSFTSSPQSTTLTKEFLCRVLPRRAGSKPLDHAVTIFDHVCLPGHALLESLENAANTREHFLLVIWRVSVGTLALSTALIPIMKRSVFVAGKYSLRRQMRGPDNISVPIVTLRTQHAPILHALAQNRRLRGLRPG